VLNCAGLRARLDVVPQDVQIARPVGFVLGIELPTQGASSSSFASPVLSGHSPSASRACHSQSLSRPSVRGVSEKRRHRFTVLQQQALASGQIFHTRQQVTRTAPVVEGLVRR